MVDPLSRQDLVNETGVSGLITQCILHEHIEPLLVNDLLKNLSEYHLCWLAFLLDSSEAILIRIEQVAHQIQSQELRKHSVDGQVYKA